MSEKYVVTWDMLQIHARKLAAPSAVAVWYRGRCWHVSWVFVMSIPYASPAMTMTTSVS